MWAKQPAWVLINRRQRSECGCRLANRRRVGGDFLRAHQGKQFGIGHARDAEKINHHGIRKQSVRHASQMAISNAPVVELVTIRVGDGVPTDIIGVTTRVVAAV